MEDLLTIPVVGITFLDCSDVHNILNSVFSDFPPKRVYEMSSLFFVDLIHEFSTTTTMDLAHHGGDLTNYYYI